MREAPFKQAENRFLKSDCGCNIQQSQSLRCESSPSARGRNPRNNSPVFSTISGAQMPSTETIKAHVEITSSLRPSRQRILLIVILLVTMMVAFFDRVNISILAANDTFLRDMGIKGHPVQIGLMMTLFLLGYGTANVCFSPLGDLLGPRKAICIAISLWAVAMFVGGITASFAVMIAARLLLGLGEGIHHPMQSKYIKKWFPPQERGRANAVWNIGTSLAPAI